MERIVKKVEQESHVSHSHIYHKYIQPLYSYGMQGCGDRTVVMEKLLKVFVHLREQGALTLTDRAIGFCLFKRFRGMLVERRRSPRYFELPVDKISWTWSSGHYSLSSPQGEAIYLKVYAKFSFQEIAAIMSIDIKEAYTLVSSGIESMQMTGQEVNKRITPVKLQKVFE